MLRRIDKDELRMNRNYTSLLEVEYPKEDQKEESIPKIKKRILSTQSYIKKLTNEMIPTDAMLPPNCRYMERFNEGHIVVIEEPPAIRTIAVDIPMQGYLDTLSSQGLLKEYGYENFKKENPRRPYMFSLAFPFTIFIFAVSNSYEVQRGKVFARTRQMSGLSDFVFKMPLNNISQDQTVCWPEGFYRQYKSLYSAVQASQRSWWSSCFNSDYTYNVALYNQKKCEGLRGYLEWQYMTRTNPLFIYSTKWVKFERISTLIDNLASTLGYTTQRNLTFNNLHKMFSKMSNTGKKVKPFKRARKFIPLYYDICQSAYLTRGTIVNVGDKFKYSRKKKRYGHVESYVGFLDAEEPRYIIVDVEGKLIQMRLTKKVKRYIATRVRSYRRETRTMIGDTLVKKGDILVLKEKGKDVFRKVTYIQRAIDGQVEVRLGSTSYLTDNIGDVDIFDSSKPKVYGSDIDPDAEYVILAGSGMNRSPLQQATKVKYKNTDVIDNKVVFRFEDQHPDFKGRTHDLHPGYPVRCLYKPEELRLIKDKVFRVGNRLFTIYTSDPENQEVCWSTPFAMLYSSNYSTERANWDEIKKMVINDTFSVKSFDLDLSFTIGDKVVVSDWKNPLNMLTVKIIASIKADEKRRKITFTMLDKHGNISYHDYVDGRKSMINVGTVRKITNKFGRLKTGTKLISKVDNIPHFPKDSVNIIIGFITDTGGDEPLVLCSNCCTLWFNDVNTENFTRMTTRSKKWETLQHNSIDIDSIKIQPGDIIKGKDEFENDFGYLVFSSDYRERDDLRALYLDYYTRYSEQFRIDSYTEYYLTLNCIPNPRGYDKRTKKVSAFPNFHGLYTIVPDYISELKFPNEAGRMIDVQSLCK